MSLADLRVPSFCPLCKCIMKGSLSVCSYYDWGVCVNCKIEFVECREQQWKDGWRPTQEQIEIYINKLLQ